MSVLGTDRTITGHGVSPGTVPGVELVRSAIGEKLAVDLGGTRLLIGLGSNPREALEALRDGLDALLDESEAA